MTFDEFEKQMERLALTYGPKAYPDERKRLVFNEFKSVGPEVFTGIVSRLIGENSIAPMLPKFREAHAAIRERHWVSEKKQNSRDALTAYDMATGKQQTTSFTEYVVNLIDNAKRDKEAFEYAVKVYGLEMLERIYQKHKGVEIKAEEAV